MEWRPFSSAFVPNTWREFLRQQDADTEKGDTLHSLLRGLYHPTPHDVEAETEKFSKLQQKVRLQRKAISQRERYYAQAQLRISSQPLQSSTETRARISNLSASVGKNEVVVQRPRPHRLTKLH